MVNIEPASNMKEEVELKLDEADKAAEEDENRYTIDEVFTRVRNKR